MKTPSSNTSSAGRRITMSRRQFNKLKRYIRDTAAYSKPRPRTRRSQVVTGLKFFIQTLGLILPKKLSKVGTAKYRESLALLTKNVAAWFEKWEEAMAVAENPT
jgi:hypothetical protein